MGRPLGSKNKKKDEVENGSIPQTESVPGDETKSEVVNNEEKSEKVTKVLPVKPAPDPLGPGQKYFEAPSGEILIGEASATHMWWRAGNGGKGMWINPKR